MGFYANIILLTVAILLILKLYMKLTTGWCKSNVCLMGKTAIITGANCGIGYETAADFAKRGAKVILACRDPNRGKSAAESIIKETDNPNVFFKQLDLASFKSVRQFSEDINKSEKRLDILVNNAGAGIIGRKKTEDGLLTIMQTNYFGHFLLVNLLLDLIKRTPNSRIVNVSSILAKLSLPLEVNGINGIPKDYESLFNLYRHHILYSRSKLCQILFTIELAKRLKDTGVTVYSLHPGIIQTAVYRKLSPVVRAVWMQILNIFLKDVNEGTQTTIYCSVAKGINHLSGQHFQDCQVVERYGPAKDSDLPGKLWEISEKLVQLC